MVKNELQIYEKIQSDITKPRKETVFPLTPTHRKELRQLRSANIGNLRDRLSTIKTLKREEFLIKYKNDVMKQFEGKQQLCEDLNLDWEERIGLINNIINQRKLHEKKFDLKHITLNSDYGDISSLGKISCKRKYHIHEENITKEIINDLFEKKYGKAFHNVNEEIEKIVTMYEEAINFGDLEIVKKLYYMMKNSENLFVKISNLKI